MGDDYDILCKDILHELHIMVTGGNDEKASKRLRKLTRLVTEWTKRKKEFEKYRN